MPDEESLGVVWFRNNWIELRRFNFQWVAADGNGFIAAATELEEVMGEVIRRERYNSAVYAFDD
jgi:hypothetical protein